MVKKRAKKKSTRTVRKKRTSKKVRTGRRPVARIARRSSKNKIVKVFKHLLLWIFLSAVFWFISTSFTSIFWSKFFNLASALSGFVAIAFLIAFLVLAFLRILGK